MKFVQLLFFAASCRNVVAVPPSYASMLESTASESTYINVPLIVISISLFFLAVAFLTVKIVYMQHRRMGTIPAPLIPSSSGFDKRGNCHCGLLVGCLGSPTWETNLISKLDGVWRRERRRSPFAYQPHARFASRSRNSSATTFTSHGNHLVLPPPSSVSSRVTLRYGSDGAKALHLPLLQHANTSNDGHLRYGDFGELHGTRSPGGAVLSAARRVSPSSIRLVDGLGESGHVEYEFLAALPPDAIIRSPFMGTRDSFQLSRCYHRRPASSLPSLPTFFPFRLPESLHAREYLPSLGFSPLGSMFRSQHQVQKVQTLDESDNGVYARLASLSSSKNLGASNAESPTNPTVVQKSQTHPVRSGLAIKSLPQTLQDKTCREVQSTQAGVLRTLSGSSDDGNIPKKPLKSCLRQPGVTRPLVGRPDSTHTSPISEVSIRTFGTRQCDQVLIRTPISDEDIGMLGLDRFHWNDEINELKVEPLHMKQDSIGLVPLWE